VHYCYSFTDIESSSKFPISNTLLSGVKNLSSEIGSLRNFTSRIKKIQVKDENQIQFFTLKVAMLSRAGYLDRHQ